MNLIAEDRPIPVKMPVMLVPVLITNAPLFTYDGAITGSLEDGTVTLDPGAMHSVDWVRYRYPGGGSLRNVLGMRSGNVAMLGAGDPLSTHQVMRALRTVYVVRSTAFGQFLKNVPEAF